MFWGLAAAKFPGREGWAVPRVVWVSFAMWRQRWEQAGMWPCRLCPCSSRDVAMQLQRFRSNSAWWLWQGTARPGLAVLHLLRYAYLEFTPQRSGLTFRILIFLTYMGNTKSFLAPLQIRPLFEISTAGWNSDLPHLPQRISNIHLFNFQIVKKKACLRMYFLLIAGCIWWMQFSFIALSKKSETLVITGESKN